MSVNPSGRPTAYEIADRLRGRWMFHRACTSEESARAALAELRDATIPAFRRLVELNWNAEFLVLRVHAGARPDVPGAGLELAATVARALNEWRAERHLVDRWLTLLLVFQLGHWAREPEAAERLLSMGGRGPVMLELELIRELNPFDEAATEALRPLFDVRPARFEFNIEPGWRPELETWTAFEARAVRECRSWLRTDYRASHGETRKLPRRRTGQEQHLRWLARWRVGGETQQAIAGDASNARTVSEGCRKAAGLIALTLR